MLKIHFEMTTFHVFLKEKVRKYIENKTKFNFNLLYEIQTNNKNSYVFNTQKS